ncbi:tyrosine-type recombinase/integrase, partial [Pseudomonas syringae pv. actinidiae]|nr:tyrosine-type recombinase/integrase [Pseudomonas syringae pv. actinidiae]
WGNLQEGGTACQQRHSVAASGVRTRRHCRRALHQHSLRRGFASWAHAAGWDLKSLMAYVGWRDIKSAMRYIDAAPFPGNPENGIGMKVSSIDKLPS